MLSIAAILAALLVGEFILSVLSPIQLRSNIVWVPDGNTKGHLDSYMEVHGSVGHNTKNPYWRENYAAYKLNKYGFRGDDWDFDFPNSLMFFGGSSVFSFHDNDNDTWPNILRDCYSGIKGKQYQIINLSQPGYSIFNAPHLYIQKGRHFSADIVFVYHFWNDIKYIRLMAQNFDSILESGVAEEPDFFSYEYVKGVLLSVGLFPNLLGNMNVLRHKFSGLAVENSYAEDQVIDFADIDYGVEQMSKYYRFLVKLLGEKNIVLIKQASLVDELSSINEQHIGYELVGMDKEKFIYAQKSYFAMLDRLAKSQSNVFVFDANTLIPKDLQYFDDHVHLQRKGQKLMAGELCQALHIVQ